MSVNLFLGQIGHVSDFDNNEMPCCISNTKSSESFAYIVVRTQGKNDFRMHISRLQTIVEQVIDGAKSGGQDLLS